MTPLPTYTNALQTVNKLLFEFLWDGKGDKIKREHIIRDYEQGGLRMIDIHTFNKSLKASWIKKYLDPTNNGRWKFFFDVNLKMYGGKFIFSCNLHKDDIPLLKIRNPFVCEVMSIWAELHFSDAVAISIANVGDQIIWLNSLVRIDNQPVFRKHWMDHGVCKISHLLDEGGSLLGYDAMKSNFQELNWLEYCSIASAVKSLINKVQNEPTYEVVSTEGTSITE